VDELTRLAHCAREGERHALESFVRLGHEPVWRLCAALVEFDAADDLAQETFLRAVSGIRQFRGEASGLTWLLSIAKRTCFDELRARERRRRRDEQLRSTGASDPVAPDIAHAIVVRDALARLPEDRRAAWVLTQMLRMSYADAAIVCECPEGTIRSRVARAREELIRQLGEPGSVNLAGEQPHG
jgi:RNA polymerase sigma-70 factor, ECF subfamily